MYKLNCFDLALFSDWILVAKHARLAGQVSTLGRVRSAPQFTDKSPTQSYK